MRGRKITTVLPGPLIKTGVWLEVEMRTANASSKILMAQSGPARLSAIYITRILTRTSPRKNFVGLDLAYAYDDGTI